MTAGAIALTGFMGAGKSTIARRLADRTGLPWLDLDELLVARWGPIPAQFARDGEAVFRAREAQLIDELCDGVPRILALGGGAYVARANRDRLRGHYVTVFLDVPLETLRERVGGDAGRPLWDDAVEARFRARQASYAEADRVVAAGAMSPDAVVDRILEVA